MNERYDTSQQIWVNNADASVWPEPRRKPNRLWLHVTLFVLTICTAFFVGFGDGIMGALW